MANIFKTLFSKIRTTPKKSKILYSALIVGFLGIGGVGGYLLGNMVFAEKIDYSLLNENELEDDTAKLMSKFNSANKANDLSKTFKPFELANIAIQNFQNHDYVKSIQKGTVLAMGVNQTVRASSIKNKDRYFLENISTSSYVKTGKRFYQEGNNVQTYDGSDVSVATAKWTGKNPDTLPLDEHTKKWGKDLTRPLIYIISSKTITNSSAEATPTGYKISLDLDPIRSVLRYVRQMISISGISNPKFNSINLTFETDKNLNLLKTNSVEDYCVDMGPIHADSKGDLIEIYTYDIETKIPELTENINYEGEN